MEMLREANIWNENEKFTLIQSRYGYNIWVGILLTYLWINTLKIRVKIEPISSASFRGILNVLIQSLI